jgi:hypothetical protein
MHHKQPPSHVRCAGARLADRVTTLVGPTPSFQDIAPMRWDATVAR